MQSIDCNHVFASIRSSVGRNSLCSIIPFRNRHYYNGGQKNLYFLIINIPVTNYVFAKKKDGDSHE
jgi:hypothetical protein